MEDKKTKLKGFGTAGTSATLTTVALAVIQTKWANVPSELIPVCVAVLPVIITVVVVSLDWLGALIGIKSAAVIVAERKNKASIEMLKTQILDLKDNGMCTKRLDKQLIDTVLAQTKASALS